MGLIGAPIQILDIENAEAFVQRCIDASGIQYSTHEREELLAEGLTILCELARKYKPHMSGHAQPGRFSGYAAMFLPRRLGDAWHKWHPEHRYVTDPVTGKRGWTYQSPAVSLDGLSGGEEPDRHLLNARAVREFCHATAALHQLARATGMAA